jgi:hypothetical protein
MPVIKIPEKQLTELRADIPKAEIPKSCPAHESSKSSKAAEDEEPEMVESDVELDQTGVIGNC